MTDEYVLVPIEPTPEMIAAARMAVKIHLDGNDRARQAARIAGKLTRQEWRIPEEEKHRIRYKAMLAARPR